jgi:tetratricopeptide (TPR) repeat protein
LPSHSSRGTGEHNRFIGNAVNTSSSRLLLEAIGLHERGAVGEAAARYSAILGREPKNIDAMFFLGVACGQQGRFDESIKLLRKVTRMAPRHARAHMFLGVAQAERGEYDKALKNLDRAIAQQPALADAHIHRGNVFAATKDHAQAAESFERALALDGSIVAAWINRGNALRALDRFDEALESYQRALALEPDLAEAHYSIGLTYEDLCRQDLAVASFERVITSGAFAGDPRRLAQVYVRRAAAYHTLGRFTEGLADAEAAMRLAPAEDQILYTLSFIDRLHGRWLEAWPKHEHRLAFRLTTPPVLARHPMWSGEPADDEWLLIKGEEGLGDQINFCRYVPYLAARGYRVAVWPGPKLVPLFQSVTGIERVIAREDEVARLGSLRWLHMLSLPHVLRTSVTTIPPTTPYLAAETARVARWSDRLGSGFKIGIHWQGNPRMTQDRIRSMPLAQFAPLAAIANVRLISLQKNPGARQIAEVAFGDRIEQPLDPSDISAEAIVESAALMAALDLVVTSDSMIAHLAGALERPVFLAVMRVPDWRWLLEGETSPWYPSMRVFRQRASGEWPDVFRRIADSVRPLVENG